MTEALSDREPSPYAKQVVESAYSLRGAIITSYAQVEFLLADVVIRCQVRPEYQGVYEKFPYKLEERIKAVRKIIAHPGPLAIYRDDIENLVDGLLAYEEIRHMMAHGLLIVKTSKSEQEHSLNYRLYRPVKGGAEEGILVTNLDQLKSAATEIAVYSSQFVRLFARVYLEQKLEQP